MIAAAPPPAIAAPAPLSCTAPLPRGRVAFDAARLREGRFTYDLAVNGGSIGQLTITIRRGSGATWRFAMESASGQSWEAVATRTMQPRSARLTMGRAGGVYTMRVTYRGLVADAEERTAPAAGDAIKASTRRRVPAQTVDQRIDWAAMMAAGLRPGARIGFHVYDPAEGTSRVVAAADAGPAIDGRPTTRLRYRICKPGPGRAPEDYVLYASTAAPYTMLREDMRGELVSTLVRAEE
jgi:hypothetical protein